MKIGLKQIIIYTLTCFILLLSVSCGGSENIDAEVIFSPDIEASMVLGEGVTTDDVELISDAYKKATGKELSLSNGNTKHEIIVGKCDRALSEKAYKKLERLESSRDISNLVIMSDGYSVAIAFDYDYYGLCAAMNDSIDYFVNNYLQNGTLKLKSGVIYEATIDLMERQLAIDEQTIEEVWKSKTSQIEKVVGDSTLAEEIAESIKILQTLYSDGIISWIANLYCPENGGFYYSNSARDNLGYLPDLESTTQALGIIGELFTLGFDGGWEELIGEKMCEELVYFAKSKQDENGYFYHPQWSRQLSDSKPNRLGRDVGNAVRILERFGAKPTYDTPTGVKGDGILADGTPVAVSSLRSPLTGSTVVAVSAVIAVNAEDANVPAHMRTREAFEAYLASLDINNDYYSVGNTLESQADQFVQRDKVLAARGENYSLADICEQWMSSHQNEETGLWNLDGLCGFEEVNGVLKLGSTYSKLGKRIPNALKALESAIDCITSPEVPDIICDIFNTWYAFSVIYSNLTTYGTPAERTEVENVRQSLFVSFPELIYKTREKVAYFIKDDGSFSFKQKYSSETSQGMPVAVINSVEGDVNATMIASISIPGTIFAMLGVPKVPIFTTSDRMVFQSILADMGYIVKNEKPIVRAVDFEDEKTGTVPSDIEKIINSTGSVLVEKRSDGKGNALAFTSFADGANVGSDEILFPASVKWYGASCNILDLDMCVLPDTDEGYFAQLYLWPTMYMIGINRSGDTIKFYEESSWTASNSCSRDVGVTAKVGEWFNLRIEFYTGTTDTTRIKVFFNGDCVLVSDNYFDSAANKLNGSTKVPLEYNAGRLLVMSNANAKVLLDDVIVDQSSDSYVPESDPADQPLRNIDSPDLGRIVHSFDSVENNALPEGFVLKAGTAGTVGTSDKALSVKKGDTLSIPTNDRGVANTAYLSFNLTVDKDSPVGSKFAFNFNEFMYKNQTLVAMHLVVKEQNGEKYAVFAEGYSGKTSTLYDGAKIPLGVETKVEIQFFFDQSAALLFVDGELVGANGSVCSGQRRFFFGEVVISGIDGGSAAQILIDDLVSERVKGNYEAVSEPKIDRVVHDFSNLSGIESDGIEASGGYLRLDYATSGGFIKIPVNSRSAISTYGIITLGLYRAESSSGSFNVALEDENGKIIASFDVVSEGNSIKIYEFTENGRYRNPLCEISNNSFELSIEYSSTKETFNILGGGECVGVSSVGYEEGSFARGFKYARISCDAKSPFRINDAYAETGAGLFKMSASATVNEDNASEVMTYETSSAASVPTRLTTAFVTSGAMLRVRESVIRGEVTRVMEYATRDGGNDILTFKQTKSASEFNAVAFETDIKIDATTEFYVDIEPMSNGSRAYQLRLFAKPNGGTVTASSKDFSKKIATEGEWFTLRMEYTSTPYDYNYDGISDIIFRVHVNGELICEGYTPYYEGSCYDASTVTTTRFFTHSSAVGEISFDNTVYEKFTMEYEEPEEYIPEDTTLLTFESGVLSSMAEATLVSDGSDISIVSKTVGSEISKVLKFTTAKGGNDYLNFSVTDPLSGANALVFETDIMIDTAVSLTQFAIEPITAGSKRAFRLIVSASKGGNVTIASDGNGSVPSTVIGKSGEWIHLKIEYMAPGLDYDLDGVKDILYKVYVANSSEPIAKGYAPYRSGEYYAPSEIARYRMFAFSDAQADIFFDNVAVRQQNLTADPAPTPVTPPPTPVTPPSGGALGGDDIYDDGGWS